MCHSGSGAFVSSRAEKSISAEETFDTDLTQLDQMERELLRLTPEDPAYRQAYQTLRTTIATATAGKANELQVLAEAIG